MKARSFLFIVLLTAASSRATDAPQSPDLFTVATYNLENYVDANTTSRPQKSSQSKALLRESILAIRPDVLALQEIGTTNALLELRADLKSAGLDLPHWEHVSGFDTNIHVAVLSRFPFTARRPHTNEAFLLYGRRFRVSRGFAEVEIQPHDRYQFTLIVAHLKSRRESAAAHQSDLREQESIRLRRLVDTRLQANPNLNLIVLGDLNDHPDSTPIKTLLARGSRHPLVDTRPAERNGDHLPNPNPRLPTRQITWTHFYGKEDVYSRIDYILLSQGMAREWDRSGTYVLALPDWGIASDHRPVVARFHNRDK
jgi:endonuclease/exonuclease/phosphatase family metal-dependent hydrolase